MELTAEAQSELSLLENSSNDDALVAWVLRNGDNVKETSVRADIKTAEDSGMVRSEIANMIADKYVLKTGAYTVDTSVTKYMMYGAIAVGAIALILLLKKGKGRKQ